MDLFLAVLCLCCSAGFPPVAASGGLRSGSPRGGVSCCREQALELQPQWLWRTRAWLLRGTWDLPGPGIKPMSPALAGRFLTTEPPGKPG